MTLDGPTHIPPPSVEREFVVYQKGKDFGITIRAETVQVTDAGVLVFRSNDSLIMAFSPSGWTFVEEAEVND